MLNPRCQEFHCERCHIQQQWNKSQRGKRQTFNYFSFLTEVIVEASRCSSCLPTYNSSKPSLLQFAFLARFQILSSPSSLLASIFSAIFLAKQSLTLFFFFFFPVQASLNFTINHLKMKLYKKTLPWQAVWPDQVCVNLQNGFVARLSQVYWPGSICQPLL